MDERAADGLQVEPDAASVTVAEIRERAYDIWERNHRPEGFEVAFWIMAERELKAERTGDRKTAEVRPHKEAGTASARAQGSQPGQ